jgi:hypothetical protein
LDPVVADDVQVGDVRGRQEVGLARACEVVERVGRDGSVVVAEIAAVSRDVEAREVRCPAFTDRYTPVSVWFKLRTPIPV